MTMLRFERDQRLGFREYMRSDGTRSYFFCLDTARALFLDAGFIEVLIFSILINHYYHCTLAFLFNRTSLKLELVKLPSIDQFICLSHSHFCQLELDYCCIKSVNRRNGKSMRRVWVHGKFQKPV